MTRTEPTALISIRVTARTKRKLKQDASDRKMPMNRYMERLIQGLEAPKMISDIVQMDALPKNEKGEIELPGGGTFLPADGFNHLKIRLWRK